MAGLSKYVINRGCDKCGKTEVGLTEIKFGKINNMLCYDCMLDFILDLEKFKSANYYKEDIEKHLAKKENK